MERVMAEMYGKRSGCSLGRGGSMHLFDAAARFVWWQRHRRRRLPLAVGLALADKLAGRNRVTACFFGDGAAAEGAFYESLNLAALWQLPVLFVCENNLYAMGTALRYSHAQTELTARQKPWAYPPNRRRHGCTHVEAASRGRWRPACGQGAALPGVPTYRFRAHSMFDPQLYRDKAEVEEWKKRDPIPPGHWMQQSGMLHEDELEASKKKLCAEVERPWPLPKQLEWESESACSNMSTAGTERSPPPPPARTEALALSFREAFRLGLIEASGA
jgi:2-oxoisovalerate dehydrogenase E1 component